MSYLHNDEETRDETSADYAPSYEERQGRQEKGAFRFDVSKRIKLERDFARVYQFRARAYNERLTVCCRPTNRDAPARLGLSVSKKVGKAHIRNRWKRLIREAFRLQYAELPQGFDYVVVPKKQEQVPSYAQIAADIDSLTRRAAKKATRFLERGKLAETTPLEK